MSAFNGGLLDPAAQDLPGRLTSSKQLYVMSYLLDFQISAMTLLNDALDLGFLHIDLIKEIFALAGILLNEKSDVSTLDYKELEPFLKEIQTHDDLMPRFKLLISQAVRTLKIVGKLRENLQMFILLKLFSNFETSSKEIKPRIEKVFKILSLKCEKEDLPAAHQPAQATRTLPAQAQAAESGQDSKNKEMQFFSSVDEEIRGFMQAICHIDMILLDFVFNISKQEMKDYSNSKYHNKRQQEDVEYVGGQIDIAKMDEQIRVAVLDVMTKYYNQRHHLLQKLIGVELIYGEEEKDLYHQLTDHRKVEQSLSIEVVKASVSKLLTLDPRWKASQSVASFLQEYESHVARITAPVTKIHEMLLKKYEQKMDFRKLQNLLKNEGYHSQLLRLFSIQYQDSNQTLQKQLFKTLVDFFYLFCIYNTANKKLLLPQLTTFIDLISYGIDTSSLVATICQAIDEPRDIGRTVDYIFKQIGQIVAIDSFVGLLNLRNSRKTNSKPASQLEAVSKHLDNMIRYKKILSGMIFDEHNFRREDTQRKIIFCLINSKELVKIYEFKFFNEIKAMISKDGNRSKDALLFYQFYAAYLSLLGEVSWEFRMGIDQARRLVTKEQIMEILTSKATPIFFKKHFLKCFHHVVPAHQIFLPKENKKSSWKTDDKLIEDILNLVIKQDLEVFFLIKESIHPRAQGQQTTDTREEMMEEVGPYKSSLPLIRPPKQDKSKRPDTKRHEVNQNLDELFIEGPKEYLEYLISQQEIDNRKYGILYFTHYILKNFIKQEIKNENSKFTNIKMEIRDSLCKMVEWFTLNEKEDINSDQSELKMMISECLAILPLENVRSVGENLKIIGSNDGRTLIIRADQSKEQNHEADQKEPDDLNKTEHNLEDKTKDTSMTGLKNKCILQLCQHVRKYLINRRISFEQLFNYLVLTSPTDFFAYANNILGIKQDDLTIQILAGLKVRELRGKTESTDLAEILKEKSTLLEFAQVLISLEAEQLTVYEEAQMKVYFNTTLKDRVHDKLKPNPMKDADSHSSAALRSSFQKFVNDYVMFFLEKRGYDSELDFWVDKIQQRVASPSTPEERQEKLDFLRALQKVLIKSDNRLFLLRSLRLTLQKCYPKLKGDALSENEETELKQIEGYREIQNLFDAAEVPVMCLSVINEHQDPVLVDEACCVLYELLVLGNSKVQKSIFKTFEENLFTQGFFSYIRDRLKHALGLIKREMDRPLASQSILEMEAGFVVQRFRGISNQSMVINLLNVLKYFCDNCYLDFQNFLRDQRTNTLKFNLHSINMLEEISEFLVGITKDRLDLVFGTLSQLVEVVLNVLTEFVLGPCPENQRVMIENRKIFEVVNNILMLKLNEKTNKERKISSIKILHQTATVASPDQFLESLVTGNENQRLLGLLVESLNKKHLAEQLIKIYIFKVMDWKKLLFLDKYCHLVDDGEDQEDADLFHVPGTDADDGQHKVLKSGCTLDACRDNKIAYFDLMLVNTGFKIFLIVKQLEDKMQNDRSLESLGIQKISDNPKFLEIRKKYSLMDLPDYNPNPGESKNLNLNLFYETSKQKGKNKIQPKPSRLNKYRDDKSDSNFESSSSSPRKLASSADRGNNELDHKSPDGTPKNRELQPQASKRDRDADEDGTAFDAEFFDNEKNIYFNEARKFFSSYVASLEINYRDKIEKVHFQIPYRCRYISSSIKDNIIREVNRNSDQERIESFFFKAKHYEYEMVKRQGQSETRLLYFLTTNWKVLKYFNYFLVLILNVLLTVYVSQHSSQATVAHRSNVYVLFQVLSYLQMVLSFLVFLLTLYDRYPVLLYTRRQNDYFLKEREKLRSSKFEDSKKSEPDATKINRQETIRKKTSTLGILWVVTTDFTNIYNFCFMCISILSNFAFNLLYAVLLFDVVSLSRTLSKILRALLKNAKLMALTCLLCLLVLYLYGVIGFIWFPQDYLSQVRAADAGRHGLQELLRDALRLLLQHDEQRTARQGRHRRGARLGVQG